jgi:hypothetical protein
MHWSEKLQWLERAAHEVHITVNDHRGDYEPIADWLEHNAEDEDASVRTRILEAGHAVCVLVYPITPIGSYIVTDADLATAVERAYEPVYKELTEGRAADPKIDE